MPLCCFGGPSASKGFDDGHEERIIQQPVVAPPVHVAPKVEPPAATARTSDVIVEVPQRLPSPAPPPAPAASAADFEQVRAR